jgi:alpha-L-fucosidase
VSGVREGSWFEGARFGVFIHWSHCSQLGCDLSWPLVGGLPVLPHSQPIPIDEYHAGGLTFLPKPGAPARWIDMAADAGARYAVLTAKHHDGYALWPTRCTDWSIERSAYGGDIVGEYVEATRSAGMKVGLYFSLSDWHHPDYPAFVETDKPYPSGRRPAPEVWERFVDEVLFGQIRELLTDYGTIDLLWFDGGWERTVGEWRSNALESMIRGLQPDIVINDRLPGVGDYETPEQFVPAAAPDGPWETCMTMGESWGYSPDDTNYKSPVELVHTLAEVAGRGGNLLLNISPDANGDIPSEQVSRVAALGSWLDRNGSAVFGTSPGLEPWQFYGPSTSAGDGRVYVFLLWRPYESVVVRGLPIRRVSSVREVAGGQSLSFTVRCPVLDSMLSADPIGEVRIAVPSDVVDPVATVLELTIQP